MLAYPVCVFFWFAAKYEQVAYSVYREGDVGLRLFGLRTLDMGVGRLRLKRSGPIYGWMGRPKAHFWEAYNGGLRPMIWITEMLA